MPSVWTRVRSALAATCLCACAACAGATHGVEIAPESDLEDPDPHSPWSFGAGLQGYPAGAILTAQSRYRLSERGELGLRAGYNFTDRGDFGEHDDEEGGGPGVGVAYRHHFAPLDEDGLNQDGWIAGANLDLWYLEIDWEDDPSPTAPLGREGSTDVLVLQPTAELGYAWRLGSGTLRRGRLELTLALGAEINADTDGEDVGEGAIALLGIAYLF
jgi:hypothetical protein